MGQDATRRWPAYHGRAIGLFGYYGITGLMLKSSSSVWQKFLFLLVIVAALVLTATMQSPLPEHLTKFDYRAYWGASRLLFESQSFSDPEHMLQIEREQTGWSGDEALMTWNPPWLLGWLLPYAAFSFDRSSWLWFLTNVALVCTSLLLLWQVFTEKKDSQLRLWIAMVLVFIYIPTLTTLLVGQITSLILFGLAGFLFFERRRLWLASGVCLALTTVKPQLVFVTLPLIMLELLRQRRWRVLAGFIVPLLAGTFLVFMFRPTFFPEYISIIGNSPLTRWLVPTLSFLLSHVTGFRLLKFIGVLIIPAVVTWWYVRRRKNAIEIQDLVIVTLLLSVLFTPFAWSFDALVLILPLMRLAAWAVEGDIGRRAAIFLLLMFIVANGAALYQRSLPLEEWTFFWFPALMAGLYVWGWWISSQNMLRGDAPTRRDKDGAKLEFGL